MTLAPLFPGMPGGIEIFVVLLIVVLLFGANKLPKLARSSGQAMGEFKKGREEIEQELAEMKGDEEVTTAESATGREAADASTDTTNTADTTATTSTTETTEDSTEAEVEKQN
jgi:sec-independent protein translocase protein TatA